MSERKRRRRDVFWPPVFVPQMQTAVERERIRCLEIVREWLEYLFPTDHLTPQDEVAMASGRAVRSILRNIRDAILRGH